MPRAASTNALMGIDWYAGNDWSLSAQYAHKYVAWGNHRDYALNDQLHAIVGYDLFHADRGMFATYDNNSELWFKLKYNF